MERRDLFKAAGTLAAAATVVGVAPAAAQVGSPLSGGNALVEMTPPSPDAFIAGRFTGKTIIVTGSARAWVPVQPSASRARGLTSSAWTG